MKARLDSGTVVEPLVRGWYAWPFLIAPGTTGSLMVGAHESMMESFIAMPEVHSDAVSDPLFAGGPFMELPPAKVDDIAALLERTRTENEQLRGLAQALTELARTLDEFGGEPLDGLYETLPDVLRGRVELVYDLSHRAAFRLIEPLFYKSTDLGLERSQSQLLRRYSQARRPNALSTPRLPDEGEVEARVPFGGDAAVHLARARWQHVDVADLAEGLGVPDTSLLPFVTAEPLPDPVVPAAAPPGELRVRYFGHACLLVQTASTSILLDPCVIFDHSHAGGWPAWTGYDLPPEIDAVVLTHTHLDHVVIETLLQLRPKIGRVLVPRAGIGDLQDPNLRLLLDSVGFADVLELGEFDSAVVGDLEVTALPFLGEHADLRVGTKAAFSISGEGRRIVSVVDSRNLDGDLYDRLRAVLGPADAVFLGMECVGAPLTWLYGTLLHQPVSRATSTARRLSGSDADQAMDLVRRLGATQAYVYAMGMEPWMWHLTTAEETESSVQRREADMFVARCLEAGLVSQRLRGTADLRV